MSGHSKWSTIKRQKGANDAKRGQLFTKLSMAITLAVKQGGAITDPLMNMKLRLAVDAAKAANMPKDNIERAIARASGKNAAVVDELVYEGFGPGGFSIIVECVSDNRLRTGSELTTVMNKNGGTMGNTGSVAYQFVQKGVVEASTSGKTTDDIFLLAADSGAEDFEEGDSQVFIYTSPDKLAKVRDGLIAGGVVVTNAELIRKPTITTELRDVESASRALDFIDKIESMEDVQKVYTTIDIPESILNQLS